MNLIWKPGSQEDSRNESLRLIPPQFYSWFPGFQIHFLNRSGGAGFFPAGVVGEGNGWNFFFVNQFLGSDFRWKRRRDLFLCVSRKFVRKFFNETLRGPGTRFAESTDGASGDVVSNRLESFR